MQRRLQLIAPTQIRLLGTVSLDRDEFKKDSVVTVEQHDAAYLIERKLAEKVAPGEKVESVNLFEVAGTQGAKAPEVVRQTEEDSAAKEPAAAGADAVVNPTVVKR